MMKLRKATIALLAMSTSLCATMTGTDYDQEHFDSDDMLAAKSVDEQQAHPGQRVIMPKASNRITNGADAYITADFIFWEAIEENLAFARSGIAATSGGTGNSISGNTFYPDFKYEPGFKVGLGLGLDHDGWDVYAQYTWYHHNAHKNTINHPNNNVNTLVPTLSYFTPSPVFYAEGSWKNRINVVEMTLGRTFFYSHYLTLRPAAGLKTAWQDQDYNVTYHGVQGGQNIRNAILQQVKSFGIGFKMGCDTLWSFNRNWGIYGNYYIDILSTRFKSTAKNHRSLLGGSTTTFPEYIETKISMLQPIFELAMGISWDNWFDDEMYHLGLRLGWEQQYWYDNNHFIVKNQAATYGDMNLQGLVFRARFDF